MAKGACVVKGGVHGEGGMHGRGACMVEVCMVRETATEADGTHPTGMHSCLCR